MPWDAARLTIPQLLCIAHKKPPGEKTLSNAADFQSYIREREDAEKAWGEPP